MTLIPKKSDFIEELKEWALDHMTDKNWVWTQEISFLLATNM